MWIVDSTDLVAQCQLPHDLYKCIRNHVIFVSSVILVIIQPKTGLIIVVLTIQHVLALVLSECWYVAFENCGPNCSDVFAAPYGSAACLDVRV